MAHAQGTVEYLVIVAVVVVLSLVVVGLLVNQTSSVNNISSSVSKISQSSGVISVSEAVLGSDGNGLITLSNNSGEVLTVTRFSVNDFNSNYSNVVVVQGNKKTFSLSSASVSGCSCVGFEGKEKTCRVVVYATSENGLEKQFTTTVSIDCASTVLAANPLSVVQYVRELPYIMSGGSKLYIHPIDNSSSAAYGCQGTTTGASSTSNGSSNTTTILAGCGTAGIAAKICFDLVYGGYDDWYLPAKDQLKAIFDIGSSGINKADYAAQWVDFLAANGYYWSSTEWSGQPANYSWDVVFASYGNNYNVKNEGHRVRCVRSG